MTTTRSRLLACVSAIAIGVLAAPSAAAEAPGTQIEEVVVTARRIEENMQNVPVSVTAIGAAQIRQDTIKNIKDLQSQAPSLFISSGLGGASAANVTLRGQTPADTLLTTDPSVGVYINGVNFPRQVGLRSAMYDIEQIQVLKGPQGTLFGKNTTGGALLLNTKTPSTQDYGGYGQLTLGTYDLGQFNGAVNVPIIQDKLAARLAINKVKRDGFGRTGYGGATANLNEESARLSVLFTPTDAVRLLVTADTTRARTGGSPIRITGVNPGGASYGTLLLDVATELGLPSPSSAASRAIAQSAYLAAVTGGDAFHNNSLFPQYGHLDQGGASADLSIRFGNNLTFRSITGERDNNRDDKLDYDTTQFSIVHPEIIQSFQSFTQEFQLLSDPAARFTWILGAFYSHEKGNEQSRTTSFGAVNPNLSYSDADVINESKAVFAQANYEVTKTLRVTAGLRYTKASEDVTLRNRNERPLGTFLNCSVPVQLVSVPPCTGYVSTSASDPTYLLSVDWRPTEDVLVYARTATSFRAGGINKATSATVLASAAPFAPEKTKDYEVGLKGDFFERRLRVNAAAYYTDYSDIQLKTNNFINGAFAARITNAAKAEIKGVEVEATARPIEALTLRASGNWIDARYLKFVDDSGDRSHEVFSVPKFQYNLSATYVAPTTLGDLSFHALYRWQDDVNFRPAALLPKAVTQKAFGLLDARISLALSKDADIALFAKNITNKTYLTSCETNDATLGYDFCFIGDPRTVGVEFLKRFGGG